MKKKKEKCERQRKKYKNINKFLRVRPNVTIFCEQGLRRIVCRYVRYWLLGQKLTKQRPESAILQDLILNSRGVYKLTFPICIIFLYIDPRARETNIDKVRSAMYAHVWAVGCIHFRKENKDLLQLVQGFFLGLNINQVRKCR